jgi:ParB family chromosome partitioning protein
MAEPSGGRRGLGRGLSALLDEADAPLVVEAPPGEAVPGLAGVREAPIELLRRNPDQPRRFFDEEALEELAESVRQKGLLQPILVRPAPGAPGEFQIVAGERRWRAAQAAQLHEVPIIVKELDDRQSLEVALIENVQRQDLTALEEAEGYRRLMEEFANTQEDLARVVGKSRSHVANIMRLLGLPHSVKALLQDGSLSAGHGRALLGAEDPETMALTVVRRGLNVRQTELLVRNSLKPAAGPAKTAASKSDADTRAIEKQLSDKLGLTVNISHHGERGEVRIAFASLEQCDEILHRLSQQPIS